MPNVFRCAVLCCAIFLLLAGSSLVRTAGEPPPRFGGTPEVTGFAVLPTTLATPFAMVTAWREARVREAQADHAAQIAAYARRYGITRQLSTQIYQAARAEEVNPALAFSLVETESGFDVRALSSRGAIGLTQIKPTTARELSPEVSAQELYSPRLNLVLGFRYLRTLLNRFDQNVILALAAYNGGPGQVEGRLARGLSPSTGFAHRVLRNIEQRSLPAL